MKNNNTNKSEGIGRDSNVHRKGMGGGRQQGPGGDCVCPDCGTKIPHQQGRPCVKLKCPDCGADMVRGV